MLFFAWVACQPAPPPPSTAPQPAPSMAAPTVLREAQQITKRPPSNCDAKQHVVFNCQMDNGRLLDLCSPNKDGLGIQYRYGPLGKPDLITPKGPSLGGVQVDQFLKMGTLDTVSIARTDFRYNVFALRKSNHQGGVQVFAQNKLVQTVQCKKITRNEIPQWMDRAIGLSFVGSWKAPTFEMRVYRNGRIDILGEGPCGYSGTGQWSAAKLDASWRNIQITLADGQRYRHLWAAQLAEGGDWMGLDCADNAQPQDPAYDLKRL